MEEASDRAQDDKYRNLGVTMRSSYCSHLSRTTILGLSRTIAFLPQGIHTDDLAALVPSADDIRQTEAVQRSSLIYRSGDRITMPAPVPMYILEN